MHHCLMALRWQRMCAIFYVHYTTYLPPMGSPYSSELIWYFYVHCNLALLGSEAQGSICEICPTNLATFLGFLGFFMDLLVQDSIWIYLFSLWPYGPIHSLWWWNLYSEGGDTTLHFTVSHCDSTTLLNQAPTPEGLGRCGVLAGGVLCLRWQQQATTATSGEGSLPFMEAWDSSFFFASDLLLLTTLAFVVNLVPTLDSGLEKYWQ